MKRQILCLLAGGFRSGLRVETSGHAPIRCQADACRNARTEGNRFFPRLLETGSGDVVLLSTHNGPVSVRGPRRTPHAGHLKQWPRGCWPNPR